METTDLAMVSRLRVEVRGGSMEAAERVADLVLDHARKAAFLEGVAPDMGAYTDHFFNYPQMIGKPTDPPDPWSELGMRYGGRIAFTFEPMVAAGGLKQYGHIVLQQEIADPPDSGEGGWKPVRLEDLPRLEEVSEGVIVLERQVPVRREHSWEHTSREPQTTEASAEDVLDNIRRLVNVEAVGVRFENETGEWHVIPEFTDGGDALGRSTSLREAALDAYGKCGVAVTHYDTEPREQNVEIHVSNLNIPTVANALRDKPYRTLIVGTSTAGAMAAEVLTRLAETDNVTTAGGRAKGVRIEVDESHDPDHYTLTTVVVEPSPHPTFGAARDEAG